MTSWKPASNPKVIPEAAFPLDQRFPPGRVGTPLRRSRQRRSTGFMVDQSNGPIIFDEHDTFPDAPCMELCIYIRVIFRVSM